MKFKRVCGNYYSENNMYMVERDTYFGWSLYTKSCVDSHIFDTHVIHCDTLHECKEIAQRYQDEADQAAAKAAAAELASIRTPGSIRIRAKADCFVGVRHVRAGQSFIITVYGDGTHAQPGNAYGKLYDFVTDLHAGLFEIIERPEPEQDNTQENDLDAVSERVHAATLDSLSKAGMLAEAATDLVSVSDLADELDTGEHGDVLCDYRDSSTYICDAIWEAADQRTSIYYSDILDFIREHPEALAEVVAEGLYEVNHDQEYDLYKHGQAAEFMMIERDLYNHMADNLMRAALCFIRYDLKREHIPADLAEELRIWCNTAYQDDRMDEIPDRIREYFETLEGGHADE